MLGSAFALVALGLLLAVASFVGSIWLVVVAFRKGGPVWGILTLVVPFANVVFAVKFWSVAKKPFLASLVPGVISGVCFMLAGGMAATAVGGEMARQAQEEARQEQARVAVAPEDEAPLPSLEPPVEESPSVPFVLNTLPPPAATAEFPAETITRDGYAPVPFADAKKYVGRVAKLVTRSGRTHRGTLISARPGSVEIEQYLGAGSIAVEYPSREIETVLIEAR